MSNKLDPLDIHWIMKHSLGMSTEHHAVFRCEQFKIQMEVITPKDGTTGEFGKPKTYYFIDDCDKEMTEVDDLCETWNELKNFDDPNNEIVWVKKIVPTKTM